MLITAISLLINYILFTIDTTVLRIIRRAVLFGDLQKESVTDIRRVMPSASFMITSFFSQPTGYQLWYSTQVFAETTIRLWAAHQQLNTVQYDVILHEAAQMQNIFILKTETKVLGLWSYILCLQRTCALLLH